MTSRLGRASTLAKIAGHEGVGERYVRLLVPLRGAALSRRLPTGPAPADLTVSGLGAVPYGWAERGAKCLPVVVSHDV